MSNIRLLFVSHSGVIKKVYLEEEGVFDFINSHDFQRGQGYDHSECVCGATIQGLDTYEEFVKPNDVLIDEHRDDAPFSIVLNASEEMRTPNCPLTEEDKAVADILL